MIELLESIPGPSFLAIFWVASLAAIIGIRLWLVAGIPDGPLPEPGRFSPAAIAFLRGGPDASLELACLRLHQAGVLVLDPVSKDFRIDRDRLASTFVAEPLETLIIDSLPGPRRADQVLAGLRSQVTALLGREVSALAGAGLIHDPRRVRTARNGALAALLIILAGGALKLLLGIANQRPVAFLVLSILALPFVFLPGSGLMGRHRPTRRGRDFLRQARKALDWTLPTGGSPPPADRDFQADPALVLGAAVFGTALFAPPLFAEQFRNSLGSADSLSGLDSSWSSGSDSGSDSGGSDGGGCGGCGGGGD